MMKKSYVLSLPAALGCMIACTGPQKPSGSASAAQSAPPPAESLRTDPDLVTLESPSPLITIKLMIRAGSTADPQGKEGLAHLVAHALVQGAFGDPSNPTTKEALAERVQPWGEGAMPQPPRYPGRPPRSA